jgi:hypothetical protein
VPVPVSPRGQDRRVVPTPLEGGPPTRRGEYWLFPALEGWTPAAAGHCDLGSGAAPRPRPVLVPVVCA